MQKKYKNAEIAASASWYITPLDDNDLPISRHAPFDALYVNNNSASNIQVIPNGSADKSFTVFGGQVTTQPMQFEYVQVKNLDASNAISANDIEVIIGAERKR